MAVVKGEEEAEGGRECMGERTVATLLKSGDVSMMATRRDTLNIASSTQLTRINLAQELEEFVRVYDHVCMHVHTSLSE